MLHVAQGEFAGGIIIGSEEFAALRELVAERMTQKKSQERPPDPKSNPVILVGEVWSCVNPRYPAMIEVTAFYPNVTRWEVTFRAVPGCAREGNCAWKLPVWETDFLRLFSRTGLRREP